MAKHLPYPIEGRDEFCHIGRNGFMCIRDMLGRAYENKDWELVKKAWNRSSAAMNGIEELMKTFRGKI